MNKGIIEQFDTQLTYLINQNEFIANFVGSHNVINDGRQKYAVRMDQIKISISKSNKINTAIIKNIEFQGEKVKISCNYKNNNEIFVTINDDNFFKNRFQLGQNVNISWDKKNAHKLEK